MKHLCRTTAIALAIGGVAFGAQAQENNNQQNQQAAAGQSYCDTAWTKVDADGDGFVSEQEASDSVQARFDSIDVDGDDRIDYAEFQTCMSARSGTQSAEVDRSEENFAEADADQDDQISRDEFRDRAERSYDDVQNAQDAEANAEPVIVLRRYVWLTPDEAQNPETFRNMSKDEAAARSAYTFDSLDRNNDDMVTADEWSQHGWDSDAAETDMQARFDTFDSDSDEEVTREEFEAAESSMLDRTETASTDGGSGSASADTTGDETQASGQGSDIPVYIYHFRTM